MACKYHEVEVRVENRIQMAQDSRFEFHVPDKSRSILMGLKRRVLLQSNSIHTFLHHITHLAILAVTLMSYER